MFELTKKISGKADFVADFNITYMYYESYSDA